MVFIRKFLYVILKLDKHKKFEADTDNRGFIPLLSYNPKTKYYRFNCYCDTCPCNGKGLCSTHFPKIPIEMLHEFDGDNIIKNFCG
jgi:hypothetical protein